MSQQRHTANAIIEELQPPICNTDKAITENARELRSRINALTSEVELHKVVEHFGNVLRETRKRQRSGTSSERRAGTSFLEIMMEKIPLTLFAAKTKRPETLALLAELMVDGFGTRDDAKTVVLSINNQAILDELASIWDYTQESMAQFARGSLRCKMHDHSFSDEGYGSVFNRACKRCGITMDEALAAGDTLTKRRG